MSHKDLVNENKQLRDKINELVEELEITKADRDRYYAYLHDIPELISYVDKDLVYRFVNHAYEKFFGVRKDKIIGKKLPGFIGKDAWHEAEKYINKVLNGEEVKYLTNFRYDIGSSYMDGHLIPDTDEAGEVKGYYAILKDVTRFIEIQDELKKSEELYRLILSNISDAVFLTDDHGNFRYVCPNVDVIFEYSSLEIQKIKGINKLFGNSFIERIKASSEKEILNIPQSILTKSGKEKKLLVNVKRVNIQRGTYLFSCRDISEKNKILDELGRVQNQYYYLIENAPSAIIVIQDGLIVFANTKGAEKLFFKRPDQLIGLKAESVIDPAFIQIIRDRISKLAQGESNKAIEVRITGKGGKQRWLESKSIPVQFNGRPAGLVIGHDITDRKKAEAVIRKQKDLMEDAERLAKWGSWEWDLERDKFTLSQGWREIHGYFEAETDYASIASLIHPDDMNLLKNSIEELRNTLKESATYLRIIRKNDGELRFIKSSGKVDLEEGGRVKRMIGYVQDVTNQRIAEIKLGESEKKYRELVENAPVGIGLSSKGKVTYANPQLLKIFGFDKQENFIGKEILAFTHPEDQQKIKDKISLQKQDRIDYPYDMKQMIVSASGEKKLLKVFVTEIFLQGERFSQGIFEDITEIEKLERDTRQLAADSLYFNEKNKMIQELERMFEKMSENYQFSKDDTRALESVFQQFSNTDKDWKIMKSHFETLNKDFFNHLLEICPALTQNELRHCAYIKMNFSTIEIARLFNIRDVSVQKARVRLKKKLRLDRSMDLMTFIHNIE